RRLRCFRTQLALALVRCSKQRQRAVGQSLNLPQSGSARRRNGAEPVCLANTFQRGRRDPRTPLDLVERGIRLVTAGEYDRRAISITQAAHLVQSQPDSHEPAVGPLESAVPAAVIDIDWPDLDAMSPSIAHDLSRRIEPHRLSVQ